VQHPPAAVSQLLTSDVLQGWSEWEYLALGICTPLPLVVYPLLFPGSADKSKPFFHQYWVKANIWIAIFGFIANYFWTHYFFRVLGAAYTMPSHTFNHVRSCC
jgi:cycloeucalenol cycloisomerase